MKKRISAILICTALLASVFVGCGDGNDSCAEITTTAAPTTTQTETTTEAPTTTTTQAETTTASALQDGVYTTSLYSVAVPEGWQCDGNDAMVMMLPSGDPTTMGGMITIVAGPIATKISEMKYDDFKASMEASTGGKATKISYGMKTFGETKALFAKISVEANGEKGYITVAYVEVGDNTIVFNLTADKADTYSKEFTSILESLKVTA